MTTAPDRPLLHSYEGENPFDIVDSAWGTIERWRAQALHTGELGGLRAIADHVRADAVSASAALEERERTVIEREQSCDARERAHAVSVTNFVDFVGKASVLFDRLEHLRADAEREAEDPLTLPPGSDAVSASGDPSDPSKDPEPSLELEGDNIQPAHGDPPGDPVTRDQTEFPDPELPRPPVTAQPISAGLDAEEFEEEKHGD